jgi:hypothetical protein
MSKILQFKGPVIVINNDLNRMNWELFCWSFFTFSIYREMNLLCSLKPLITKNKKHWLYEIEGGALTGLFLALPLTHQEWSAWSCPTCSLISWYRCGIYGSLWARWGIIMYPCVYLCAEKECHRWKVGSQHIVVRGTMEWFPVDDHLTSIPVWCNLSIEVAK